MGAVSLRVLRMQILIGFKMQWLPSDAAAFERGVDATCALRFPTTLRDCCVQEVPLFERRNSFTSVLIGLHFQNTCVQLEFAAIPREVLRSATREYWRQVLTQPIQALRTSTLRSKLLLLLDEPTSQK